MNNHRSPVRFWLAAQSLLLGGAMFALVLPATPGEAEGCGGGGYITQGEVAAYAQVPTNGVVAFHLIGPGEYGWNHEPPSVKVLGPDSMPVPGTVVTSSFYPSSEILAVWKPDAPLAPSTSYTGELTGSSAYFHLPIAFTTGSGPADFGAPPEPQATLRYTTSLTNEQISCGPGSGCGPHTNSAFGGEQGRQAVVTVTWALPAAPKSSPLGLYTFTLGKVDPASPAQAAEPAHWDGSPTVLSFPFTTPADEYCVEATATSLISGVGTKKKLCLKDDPSSPTLSALREQFERLKCPFDSAWPLAAKQQWCSLPANQADESCQTLPGPGGAAGSAGSAGSSGSSGMTAAGGNQPAGASGASGAQEAGNAAQGTMPDDRASSGCTVSWPTSPAARLPGVAALAALALALRRRARRS